MRTWRQTTDRSTTSYWLYSLPLEPLLQAPFVCVAPLGLDHIERLDGEWSAYLAEAVASFVISASEPPSIDQETAAWLVTVLSAAQPRTAAAIVRTIECEGYQLSENLAVFTRRAGRALPSPRAGRLQLDCPSDSCSLPGE